ncbi:hypothetical protein EJ03DRAFT_377532 [Teratosphaeria nubilosa]|uniref:Uncharacterized protein n=1 Tax=Teratosphaeria nubilosa TaxID=161662 RepID=A0A6G1KYP7_9PEZI|nr:hypothetical protein EJ03DRAFT_377532 [Teratosphaeria nubilosa]
MVRPLQITTRACAAEFPAPNNNMKLQRSHDNTESAPSARQQRLHQFPGGRVARQAEHGPGQRARGGSCPSSSGYLKNVPSAASRQVSTVAGHHNHAMVRQPRRRDRWRAFHPADHPSFWDDQQGRRLAIDLDVVSTSLGSSCVATERRRFIQEHDAELPATRSTILLRGRSIWAGRC